MKADFQSLSICSWLLPACRMQIPDAIAFANRFITFDITVTQFYGVSENDSILERINYSPLIVSKI